MAHSVSAVLRLGSARLGSDAGLLPLPAGGNALCVQGRTESSRFKLRHHQPGKRRRSGHTLALIVAL